MPMANKKYFWISVLFIILSNTFVFYPSFYHNARADQLVYLIETADLEDLGDSINYSYSYCRNRLLLTGDKMLFRPLFYIHLSLEKWLFGYNFFLWQVEGFLLHLAVIGLMLRMFLLIRPHFIAGIWAGSFSVLLIIAEMVIWHHISGYLLFLIFLLLALSEYILYLRSARDKYLWTTVLYLTPAIFIYEFGVICCAVMAMMLMVDKGAVVPEGDGVKPKQWLQHFKPVILMVPVMAYGYVNVLDYYYRFAAKNPEATLAFGNGSSSAVLFLKSLAEMLWMGISMPFLPYFGMLFSLPRTAFVMITGKQLLEMKVWPVPLLLNMLFVLVVIGLMVYILITVWCQRRRIFERMRTLSANEKIWRHFFILGVLLALGYVVMMVVGRTLQEGREAYMVNSIYHFYPVCLFLTVAGYILFSVLDEWLERKKGLVVALVIILVLGGVLNGARVYDFNVFAARKSAPWSRFFCSLYAFIKERKAEDNFSFRILWRDQYSLMQLKLGDPVTGKPIDSSTSDLLFRKYMRSEDPKYYLVYKEGLGLKVFTGREEGEAFVKTLSINQDAPD